MLCRVFFCENCARRHSPHYADSFLAFGSKRNDYVVYRSRKEATRFTYGFTPHLFDRGIVENDVVAYRYACSMFNCDCHRKQLDNGTYFYFIPEENWKLGFMPLKEWNALVNFKNSGYKI